jgi:ribosomal protein S12 methylthiotransferase
MLVKSVYLETLGCEKNTVDSEIIIGILESRGYTLTQNPEDAHVIIVNTCAFIQDAKKEAIDTIFQLHVFREHGKCERLVITGCLPERYPEEIAEAFPEVDAYIGVNRLTNILDAIEGEKGSHIGTVGEAYEEYETGRRHTGNAKSAFIRIADGCDAACSFCAIPQIRGAYRSRSLEEVVREVRRYAEQGFGEINLIAQETTFYGMEQQGHPRLTELLKEINTVDGIRWVRVMYQNPIHINDELIDTFFSLDKIIPYFDIPLQHSHPGILKNMRRGGSAEDYLRLIESIRSRGECAIRSAFITGFPGEGDTEFEHLTQFITDAQFDRMGIFVYSPEENTPALSLDDAKVSVEEAMFRRETLMERQIEISAKRLSRFVDTTMEVIVENASPDEIIGRSRFDAPEVDGYVNISPDDGDYAPGDFINVTIDYSDDYDLHGELANIE